MFFAVRAPIWSLLVTITFVLAELWALWALKTLTLALETRILRRKVTISLKRHCRRLRVIAAVLLVMFLVCETLTSTFTNTVFRDVDCLEDCLELVPLSQNSAPNILHDVRSEIILFHCVEYDGALFGQRLGRFSLDKFEVSCEEQRHYSYNNSVVQRATSSAQMRCANSSSFDANGNERREEYCVFYEVEGDVLFVSEVPFLQPEAQDQFLVTRIERNMLPLLRTMADRYLHFRLEDPETEELYARGVMFTDLIRTRCLFPTDAVEGVDVSNSVLIFVASLELLVISSAILVGAVTCKMALINLSDPFFWSSTKFAHGTSRNRDVHVDEYGGVSVCAPADKQEQASRDEDL